MADRVFDRETLLDLIVNIIPLAIIGFFAVLFAAVNPFGFDLTYSTLSFALLVVPFVLLAILTYLSGRAIAGDEKHRGIDVERDAQVVDPDRQRSPGGGNAGDDDAGTDADAAADDGPATGTPN